MENTGHKITHTKNGHVLTAVLYGEVTPEKIDAAKKALAHRAEQLYSPAKTPSENWNRNERTISYRSKNDVDAWDEWGDDEFGNDF
jgi:hypothetical protein